MARVTYAALGLAFAALVSGFFVRDSSIPLIASIALSAVVSVLILFGWTRKMRREGFGFETDVAEVGEIEEIPLVEVDEVGKLEVEEVAAERKRGRRLGKVMAGISRRPAPDDTIVEAPIVEPAVRTPRPKPAAAKPPVAKPPVAKPPVKPTAAKPASPRPKALAQQKPSVRPKASVAAGGRSRRKVFVIPGRERYHSADCRYAHGDDLREVSEDLARRRGYTPCGLCLKK